MSDIIGKASVVSVGVVGIFFANLVYSIANKELEEDLKIKSKKEGQYLLYATTLSLIISSTSIILSAFKK